MIGWESTHARDADEAIQNGLMDNDLERLKEMIEGRIIARDEQKEVPITLPRSTWRRIANALSHSTDYYEEADEIRKQLGG